MFNSIRSFAAACAAWPAATRFAAGTVGVVLIAASLATRQRFSSLLGVAGATALLRAIGDDAMPRLASGD